MTESLVSLVDKATSEYLVKTDWDVVMQICDTINRDGYNPVGCRDVVRQIAKRMKMKETSVSMFALELAGTLVKNCEVSHTFIGGKEFQDEIVKLIQNKSTKEVVKTKALELVQYWADSFQSRKDVPLFNQTCLALKRSGVAFPPRRADDIPLVFKSAAAPEPRRNTPPPKAAPVATSVAASGLPEFSSLQESVNLALEMLSFTNPEEEDPSTNEILRDVITTCKDAGPTVRSAIETGNFSSEAQMFSLLSLNDEIVRVQSMFDDLVARRQTFLTHGPQPKKAEPAPPAAHPPATSNNTNLIDLAFGDLTLNAPSQPTQPAHTTHTTPTHHQPPTATTTSANPLGDLDFIFSPAPTQPTTAPSHATIPSHPVTTPNHPITPIAASPSHPIPTIKGPTTGVRPTTPPTQTAAIQTPAQDFDDFDMFAQSRHATPPSAPVPMDTPLQPTLAKPRATSPANPSPNFFGSSTFPSG